MSANDYARRDFLKLGLAAGAAMAVAAALPRFSLAAVAPKKMDEIMSMSPTQMAQASKLVTGSMKYLEDTVKTIKDAQVRQAVQEIMANPAPTLMGPLMNEADRKKVYDELSAKGLIKDVPFDKFLPAAKSPAESPEPFIAGPGSGYQSHHSYPGGLITHTAANLVISLAIHDTYSRIYGYELDRDAVIASQALHDLHKPWVFQWGADGESRTELPLAGTGEHHTLGVAESFKRGLPAHIVVAQACAHNHPGFDNDEKGPVNWLTAASVLLGVDPAEKGLLAKDGKTLPQPRLMENFVCHLGDHDWILTVPAAKWTIPVMAKIAQKEYGLSEADLKAKPFKQLRNYVFSQATIMTLYHELTIGGEEALTKTVKSIVLPV